MPEQDEDEIRLGLDDGPSGAPDASGVSAASRGPFYFAWGCFRDFVSGPCGAPQKGDPDWMPVSKNRA